MDTYDEMTGISIRDIDIEKISEDGSTAVEQVKKLVEDEYPEFKISGPNGGDQIRYYSIQKCRKNIMILEDYDSKKADRGLLTTPDIKQGHFYKRGYDKLNWQDVFYGNRMKYDTKGKSVDEIRSIFNHFK
tara:strand:+ start:121 stop:513 length:393 start_codon:yes stop_codon:yes gene_type:complete